MQRVNSGIFQNVVPSGQKPPRAPVKARSAQMDSLERRDGGVFGRDLEKGSKSRWRLRADQAVHLVPVVLLLCLFVLYVCSSLPLQDHSGGLMSTGLPHRRLQAADLTVPEEKDQQKDEEKTGMVRTEVRVTKHDLHRPPLRLRGGRLHR